MNYLVLDLEMCKVPKHYRNAKYKYATEIIQIGAVLLDQEFNIIAKLNQYVRPQHGVLDSFITNLTGIKKDQLKHAPCLEEALMDVLHWLGDREYKIYAWSDSDYYQLSREIKSKNITNLDIENFLQESKWIDYQKEFGERFDFSNAVSLSDALMYCNIEVDGRLHDGLDDAINTAALIRTLEHDPDFMLYNREVDFSLESEPLNFTMGDLFAGLKLGYTG